MEDSITTTTTNVSHPEMTLTTDPAGCEADSALTNNHFHTNGGMLPLSTSNTTSLSGNDYVEVSATGEAKPLSRKVSNALNKSSNSLCKGQLCAASGDDVVQGLERKYNPYDNIPDLKMRGVVAGDEKGGLDNDNNEAKRKSSASACCHSEFVNFIDNLEERCGSTGSLMR